MCIAFSVLPGSNQLSWRGTIYHLYCNQPLGGAQDHLTSLLESPIGVHLYIQYVYAMHTVGDYFDIKLERLFKRHLKFKGTNIALIIPPVNFRNRH